MKAGGKGAKTEWEHLLGDSISWFPARFQRALKSPIPPSKWPEQQQIMSLLAIACSIRANASQDAIEQIKHARQILTDQKELIPFLKGLIISVNPTSQNDSAQNYEKLDTILALAETYVSQNKGCSGVLNTEIKTGQIYVDRKNKIAPQKNLLSEIRIILIAPIFERSGYGNGSRGIFFALKKAGVQVRVIPIGATDKGIDDCPLGEIENALCDQISPRSILLYYSVPHEGLLSLKVPEGTQKFIITTFEGIGNGTVPPESWLKTLYFFDRVYVPPKERQYWLENRVESDRLTSHEKIPHVWSQFIPKASRKIAGEDNPVQFLCIGMYAPRRRWDILIEAFCRAFPESSKATLLFKVNYPSWHPEQGKPRSDFLKLIENKKVASGNLSASIIVDENLGTRLELAELIKSSDYIVNTDSSATQSLTEALILERPIITGRSHESIFDVEELENLPIIFFDDDSSGRLLVDEEMSKYQPHHKNMYMPCIDVEKVIPALQKALEIKKSKINYDFSSVVDYGDAFIYQIIRDSSKHCRGERPTVSIEGPFFAFHSLAKINREIARYFSQSDVFELCIRDIGTSDFDPLEKEQYTYLARLHSISIDRPDFIIRHMWPPKFERPDCGVFIMIQPWEFGCIPSSWVAPINNNVDQVWVPSNWVRDCYINSGIDQSRVKTIPNGVDCTIFRRHGDIFNLKSKKKFKFLFLGGTIHRKGIDVLLNTYIRQFTAQSDVCLVIKDQSGGVYSDTEVSKFITNLTRHSRSPEIEYICEGFDEESIASLYRACDCLVVPYRGEGFCMPILEAMATGLPVIATGAGASSDFFFDDWGYRLRSKKVTIDRIGDFSPSGVGFWLEEPCQDHLAELMMKVIDESRQSRRRAKSGTIFAESMSWEAVGKKMTIEMLQHLKVGRNIQSSA